MPIPLRFVGIANIRPSLPLFRQAGKNDVVMVKKGNYSEGKIIIDKPLTLIGEGFPVVEGDGQSDVFFVDADSVIHFRIRNQEYRHKLYL